MGLMKSTHVEPPFSDIFVCDFCTFQTKYYTTQDTYFGAIKVKKIDYIKFTSLFNIDMYWHHPFVITSNDTILKLAIERYLTQHGNSKNKLTTLILQTIIDIQKEQETNKINTYVALFYIHILLQLLLQLS